MHTRRMTQRFSTCPVLLAALAAMTLAACAPADTPAEAPGPAPATAWAYPSLNQARPLVIAHRGASGDRPEHTIEAYDLALQQGADCIEPDLVMTKDGVLVSRHDIYLSTTTDVADHPEFADRKRAAPDADHAGQEDWWVIDFTLAELKTLRARQPFEGRSKEFDGQFEVPTFDEVLDFAATRKTRAGAPVCIYPEAKAPAFHAASGHDMAAPILDALRRVGMEGANAPVFIQSFEPDFVQRMNDLTETPVVMLVSNRAALDNALAKLGAPFWDGLGPNIGLLFNADGSSTGVIEASHAQGIPVHAWTYRDDQPMRNPPFEGKTAADAMRRAFEIGLDGAFTDHPATGVSVVDSLAR